MCIEDGFETMDTRTALVVFVFCCCVCMATIPVPASAQECPLLFTPRGVTPTLTSHYSVSTLKTLSTTLNSTIESYTSLRRIYSYAVAVVKENQTIFTAGLPSTPFRIASITKTLTTLGALMLREQRRLMLDDAVQKFLPSFSIISPYGEHNTTLRELMGHAAGFPRDLCPMLFTCTTNETEILTQIAGMQLISPPWSTEPAYSNLGISVLGRAWEKATDPPMLWEEFVMEKIAKPLGMNSTGVNLTNVDLAPNNNPYARQDLGWSAPAAQMYSTANDLAEYLKFLITGNPRLISESSRREWISPATIFSDGLAGFSYPWELQKLDDNSTDFLITKSGDINGYQSHIAFDTLSEVGVVVLAVFEQGSGGDPTELANIVLRSAIPAVELVNQEILTNQYGGLYTCQQSEVLLGPTLNYTVQVMEGTINITANSSVGLLADVNVRVLNSGQPFTNLGTWALLLKNATENSFWYGDGTSCQSIVGSVSSQPDLENPNTPGSLYTNVLVFDPPNGTLMWPAVGGRCYKAGFSPSTAQPHGSPSSSLFASFGFSFLLFFFMF